MEQDNKFEQIYDEFASGIDQSVDSFYDEMMDLMTVVKEGHGFRSVGGVMD